MSRVVFMGSPDFAVPTLQALIDAPDIEVVGVVTQPDRPAGRGGQVKMQPIKHLALQHNLDIYQPEKLRGAEALDRLRAWNADIHVVTAYGQILRREVLDIPRMGSLNVHASLLPRWRGAAPLQAAIKAGDAESGNTIMLIDEGLDTGAMLLKGKITLDPRETGGSLHDKLSSMGGTLLLEALRGYLDGKITPEPQNDDFATFAPRLTKADEQLNWSQSALEIDRHVRAFNPVPSTFTLWNGKVVKIFLGEPLLDESLSLGQVARGDKQHPLLIGTGSGVYAPSELQLEGKKRLSAMDFLNGNAEFIGASLENY